MTLSELRKKNEDDWSNSEPPAPWEPDIFICSNCSTTLVTDIMWNRVRCPGCGWYKENHKVYHKERL